MRVRQAGFTLVELLVVLAILAGLGAIAGPPLARLYDRIAFSLAREDVERAIGALPEQARLAGHSLWLVGQPDPGEAVPADPLAARAQVLLPRGWRLEVPRPIQFRFDGLCLGGEFTIIAESARYAYRLDAPFCRPALSR